jgi:hypothetical protein
MDALRSELREFFWDGEFRDTLGAAVTCSGKPHHPFAVYRSASGQCGLVICNYDEETPAHVQPLLTDGAQLKRWRLVENPTWHAFTGEIEIPPQSAVVVI